MKLPIFIILIVIFSDVHHLLIPSAFAMAQDTELIQSGAGQLIELESIMKLPWEGLLQSAPLSIFLLGQLVVVSARRDFQLEMNVNRPYQRLRHSTFRPTVVQVVNEAWVAFNHAHTNMDQVRLHMLSIPRNVRVTLRIMNRDQQFAHFVKIPLKAIEQSADEAAQLSLDIYNKFYNIQLLLAEVAEALASTQGGTDEQLRQAQEDRKLAEMEKKLQDERQAKARGELNKISGELDAARSAYEEAIRSIPTGFKAFFMDLVRFVPNLIPKIGDGQTIPFETAAVDQQQELSVNDLSLIGMADNIERGVIRLIQTLNSGGNGAFDHLNTFKKGLSDLKRQAASKTDAKLFGPVNELVNTGFSIIDDMLRTFDDYNSQEFQQLRDRLVKLERDAKTIASVQGQIRTNRPLSATESISSSGSSNEQFITALRQQQLQNLERRYDIAFQRLLNEHQKLTEVLLRLARLNLDAANFNEILEILRGAINAVSQIRVNWAKLLEFFQLLSNEAKITMKQQVAGYLSYTTFAVDREESQLILQFFKEEIYERAVGTASVANFLHSVSSAYMNVSRRYIMDRLAGLNSLLTITDTADQQAKLIDLQRESVEVQAAIRSIGLAHKQEFEGHLKDEKLRIDEIFEKIGQPFGEDRLAIEKGKQLKLELFE